MIRPFWVLIGLARKAKRRAHVKLHRLYCYFGVHQPVGAMVYLPTGEYLVKKTLEYGGVSVPVTGHLGLEQQGRYYIPTGADPYGQRDSTGPIQNAMDVAFADKRKWCEFCNVLLSEGDSI